MACTPEMSPGQDWKTHRYSCTSLPTSNCKQYQQTAC